MAGTTVSVDSVAGSITPSSGTVVGVFAAIEACMISLAVGASTTLTCCFAGQNTIFIVGGRGGASALGITPMMGSSLAPKPLRGSFSQSCNRNRRCVFLQFFNRLVTSTWRRLGI